MKHLKLIIFLIIFSPVSILNAQFLPGKLLLVGGGSEKINGWSDAPYAWAVDQSDNKRVAIITYDPEVSSWLPNYFLNLGAVEAKNFIIPDQSIANLQETYDSLVTYDVIFFKGGDQWKYYDYYKNTLLHQALEEVYLNGGVIGGTSAGLAILSGVIFTAENGTVYPEEALENPFKPYMTLKDDFLNLFPGYIFDSHFVERARFGRLLGFLGNRLIGNNETLTGIGVDDKTAFCIDSDYTGYAFGTGAVNIYLANEGNNFRLSGEKLLANSMNVIQLLNECSINLNSFEVNGLQTWVEPEHASFNYRNPLWLSGSDQIYDNTLMLEKFTESASIDDSILIITGTSTSLAGFFKDYLTDDLGKQAMVLQAIQGNADDPLWEQRITTFNHYLFVGNEYQSLMDFLINTANGSLLKMKISEVGNFVAFVGGNSRFAGHTVLVNYEQEYASYDGLLEFEQGLDLLRNAIIMPNTFSGTIDNENAAAGVPYGMVLNNLRFGIWLFDDCFMHYNPHENEASVTSYGNFPMIWIENNGSYCGFSDQSAVSSGEPRDVAGFDSFTLALLDSTVVRQYDRVSAINLTESIDLHIFPNPADDWLKIKGYINGEISIYNQEGSKIFKSKLPSNGMLDISSIKPGVYIVCLKDKKTKHQFSTKVIIR
ncbi:MAG: T9SS type A sorting domain-containing protein [Bacteroidetes bacterium]|nr:T9SS type A sorting domain-containing protein [Bacteroidota bacterium]